MKKQDFAKKMVMVAKSAKSGKPSLNRASGNNEGEKMVLGKNEQVRA